MGIWRNGRRSGLNQIEPRYGDVSSDSPQIQGNLGLFSRQSWAKSCITRMIFGRWNEIGTETRRGLFQRTAYSLTSSWKKWILDCFGRLTAWGKVCRDVKPRCSNKNSSFFSWKRTPLVRLGAGIHYHATIVFLFSNRTLNKLFLLLLVFLFLSCLMWDPITFQWILFERQISRNK